VLESSRTGVSMFNDWRKDRSPWMCPSKKVSKAPTCARIVVGSESDGGKAGEQGMVFPAVATSTGVSERLTLFPCSSSMPLLTEAIVRASRNTDPVPWSIASVPLMVDRRRELNRRKGTYSCFHFSSRYIHS
jgi:hypothetical protein